MSEVLERTIELPIDTAAKRARVESELRTNAARSDREIARVVGCDHKTVGTARERLGIATPLGNSPPSPTERRAMLIQAVKDFDQHFPPGPSDVETTEEAVDCAIAKGVVSLVSRGADDNDPSFWEIPRQARIECRGVSDGGIEIVQEGQHANEETRIFVTERNVAALARRILWAGGFASIGIFAHTKGGGCIDLDDGDTAEDVYAEAEKPGYGPVR